MKLPKIKFETWSMKNVRKNKKLMIVGVLILAALFTTQIGFIAVENLSAPVVSGTVSVTAFEVNLDQEETWIWNIGEPAPAAFDAATVKGTIEFKVTMTGDPVNRVQLTVEGTSTGASTGGGFSFAEVSEGVWALYYDTTTLNDGEYLFTLSYFIGEDGDEGGAIAFSSFVFINDDGEIIFDIPDTILTLLLLSAGGFLILVFVVRKGKRK